MSQADNNVYVIYKEKKSKYGQNFRSIVIWAVVLCLLGIGVIFSKDIYGFQKIAIAVVLFISAFLCIKIGLKINEKENATLENALKIKKCGDVIQGEVVRVQMQRSSKNNGYVFRFIIKFEEYYGDEKYLITNVLPSEFCENDFFNKISTERAIGADVITIKFWYGDGYMTFDKNDARELKFMKYYSPKLVMVSEEETDGATESFFDDYTYTGPVTCNFEGKAFCKVYKYQNRYVIDDYEINSF